MMLVISCACVDQVLTMVKVLISMLIVFVIIMYMDNEVTHGSVGNDDDDIMLVVILKLWCAYHGKMMLMVFIMMI